MTDDPDIRLAQSIMDYIFRRLALDHLPYETRAALGVFTTTERAAHLDAGGYGDTPGAGETAASPAGVATDAPAAAGAVDRAPDQPAAAGTTVHSTAELLQAQQGMTADAPLCLTCGVKMRPSGSCFVCESCGSTSGCS
jgi:ribonucleoside-diphosphate reductase alpha chain